MSEPFAYHAFAHASGRYQTVATLGTSEAEAKALEQFFFGQTNDKDYLASLEEEPGIIWRIVNARGALTRVRQGKPDSNGRATLQFETLLVPADKLRRVTEQLAEIVGSEWKTLSNGLSIFPNASRKPLSIHPEQVSDVLMAVQRGQRVARRADGLSLQDVSKIIAACSDDPTFSLCFKSLNKTAPVSVNLVSLDIMERNMSSQQPKAPQVASVRSRPDVRTRASSRTDTLILAAVCIALTVQIVMFWLLARPPAAANSLDQMQNLFLGRLDDLDKKHTKLEEVIASLRSTVAEGLQSGKKDHENLIDKIGQVDQGLNDAKKALDTLKTSESGIAEVSGRIKSQTEGQTEKLKELESQLASLLKLVTKGFEQIEQKINASTPSQQDREPKDDKKK